MEAITVPDVTDASVDLNSVAWEELTTDAFDFGLFPVDYADSSIDSAYHSLDSCLDSTNSPVPELGTNLDHSQDFEKRLKSSEQESI